MESLVDRGTDSFGSKCGWDKGKGWCYLKIY